MKSLIIFGSKSDKKVYSSLINNIESILDVEFTILSAHRNPIELDNLLKNSTFDIVITGAGLAAHLPGVIASKTKSPVFGLPVNAHLGGIDALLSIVQMPFGVPVLSSGVEKIDSLSLFIQKLSACELKKKINIVVNPNIMTLDFVKKELGRTYELAKEISIEIQTSSNIASDCFNIQLINNIIDIKNDDLSICVPVMDKEELSKFATSNKIYRWCNNSNLWVGTNNTKNALLFYKKLLNIKGN